MFPATEDVSALEYSSKALSYIKGVTFAYINLCSVIRKLDYVKVLLRESKVDYLAVGETFLNSSIEDNELYIDG